MAALLHMLPRLRAINSIWIITYLTLQRSVRCCYGDTSRWFVLSFIIYNINSITYIEIIAAKIGCLNVMLPSGILRGGSETITNTFCIGNYDHHFFMILGTQQDVGHIPY